MEWGEEKPIQYQVRYSSDTNELPEIEERLLRLENELERINKLLMENSTPLDPAAVRLVSDHFLELG